jgi:hypothetical protein
MINETKKNKPVVIENGETSTFDRELKISIPGIAEEGARFKLENKYYVNESETIILRSNEKTGRFFRLVKD